MSTTVLGIYNAAISAAHGKGRLSSLSDVTVEREECDIWYPLVRDQVQEAAYWPGCRSVSRLNLLDTRDFGENWEPGDAEPEFKFAYGLPSDYLRAWHLANFERFSLSFSVDKIILSTFVESAVLIYALRQENPAHWTPGQREATIYALAAAISGKLTGDPRIIEKNYGLADQKILAARSTAWNAQNMQPMATPPALQARGYDDPFRTEYYHPNGPLFLESVPNAT